uniref:Uncharacterized protein n=1 Tax=Acrobeloides nanus TaxID=290746 RepID=A0A914D3J4_9BILA
MIDDDPSGDFHGHKKLFLALRVTVNGAGAILWQCQEDGVIYNSLKCRRNNFRRLGFLESKFEGLK